MPTTEESVTPVKALTAYLCALAVLAVPCAVAKLTGKDAQAWLWAGLAVAVTVLFPVAVYVTSRRARRSADVDAWAEARGWSYVRATSAVPRAGRDVLRAVRDGVEVVSYETIAAPDLGSESLELTRHAVAAAVPGDLPTLTILPETAIREAGAARRARGIQFESAAFNARWRVHCDDDRFAHAFCHPRLMERLMQPDADGVSVLVDGRDVVVHAPGPQDLEVLDARAALTVDLVRLVPAYLLEQHPPRTSRRRQRTPEHSRVAAALALLWAFGWLAFLVLIGAAGGVGVAVGLGVPTAAVIATVLVVAARRRRERV